MKAILLITFSLFCASALAEDISIPLNNAYLVMVVGSRVVVGANSFPQANFTTISVSCGQVANYSEGARATGIHLSYGESISLNSLASDGKTAGLFTYTCGK